MPATYPDKPSIWGRTVTTRLLELFGVDKPHDRFANFLVAGDLLRWIDDLEINPLHGIEAQQFVEALPYADRQQAALDISGKRLLVEHLCEPIELANIALNYPQSCLSVDRPQLLKHDVEFGCAEPELLPNHLQASAADYRLRDLLISLLDHCISHA
jgi:hypothetical protein